MSFLPINEQNQLAPQGQTTAAPAGGPPPQQSGGSVGAGGAGGAPKGSAVGTPAQFGSSASKLGDYLSANAPQIQGQADKVSGQLNQQYGQLNQGITDAANQFQQQVGAGYTAPNQQVVNQAVSNPTGFASDPNNVKAFQAQYNNQYTGPQTFESTAPYSQIQGSVSNAVQNSGLLNSQAGLQSYLAGQQKNPTAASSTLDSLLLSGNPGAKQQVQTAAGQFKNLTGQLDSAKSAGNKQAQDAQKAAQDSQTYARNQIGGVVDQFGNKLNSQLTAANTNRDAYNNAVTQNQPQAQDAKAKLLAAQQAAGQKYSGTVANNGSPELKQRLDQLIDPSAYLTQLAPYLSGQPITQPGTLGNVANADQYAQDAALESLLGDNYNQLLNPAEAGQAGSYSVPTLPGSVPNVAGESQYIGDIGSLYGNPGIYNVNAPGGWQNATPQQLAQSAANMGSGQGYNADPDTMAALQRIIANQYEGRK